MFIDLFSAVNQLVSTRHVSRRIVLIIAVLAVFNPARWPALRLRRPLVIIRLVATIDFLFDTVDKRVVFAI